MEYSDLINHKKITSTMELKEQGLSYYQINKLVSKGILYKLNKSFYENLQFTGEESDLIYAYAYAPDGVICMMSAAKYYNLTSYRPECVDVAIHNKKKVVTLPTWPQFKIWYFNTKRLETGITKIVVCNQEVNIYDMEKTVIDIIRYRNKIGVEETKEILVNYLNRSERNINKLYRYAKILRCENILNTYLEVLL